MKPDYYSFLLKLWAQNPQNDEIYWRASLRSPESGELISFKDISELTRYLNQLINNSGPEYVRPIKFGPTPGEDD